VPPGLDMQDFHAPMILQCQAPGDCSRAPAVEFGNRSGCARVRRPWAFATMARRLPPAPGMPPDNR
jgi:hypothetical protein